MTLSAYVPIIGLFGLATAFAVISLLGARWQAPAGQSGQVGRRTSVGSNPRRSPPVVVASR